MDRQQTGKLRKRDNFVWQERGGRGLAWSRIFLCFFLFYVIQHCFICRPLDSTVSEDLGIEPTTVANHIRNDRKKAWSSINPSILSGSSNRIFLWPLTVRALICCKISSIYISLPQNKRVIYAVRYIQKAKLARCLLHSVCCIHCKKGLQFFHLQPGAGCHQPNSPWRGII